MTKITKAVFPVAGFGSRFLPATKAQPKEMLPIVDKPLIQYAVEEAVQAGINELIFITGRNKRAIEDHFDKAYELEKELAAAGKQQLLETVQDVLPANVSCIYIRQMMPLGLGHAVLCARPVVGKSPFAVLLADDFMMTDVGKPSVLSQMVNLYEQDERNILAVQEVDRASTKQYGIVDTTPCSEKVDNVHCIVEKPMPEQAPSTTAVVGRYILKPEIFDSLATLKTGAGGEYQLTDAISEQVRNGSVCAYHFDGKRFDCGSKLGYLQATLCMGMRHEVLGKEFTQYVRDFIGK